MTRKPKELIDFFSSKKILLLNCVNGWIILKKPEFGYYALLVPHFRILL